MRSDSHYAKIENSPRLQRTLKFLSDGLSHTTREIIIGADICAVSTVIHELRLNGKVIECRAREGGRGIYEYQMEIPLTSIVKDWEGQGILL